MDVTSLGYQTDLALLKMGGSEFDDRDQYLVVRTPDNPTHWWGNFLLLAGPPPVGQGERWLETFAAEFPDARHVALGFDGVDGAVDDLADFTAAGLNAEGQTVMTAKAVHEPRNPYHEADYRTLATDDDWAQHVDLRVVCRDDDMSEEGHREYATRRAAAMRRLVEAGHGAWFGAFEDGKLLSSMGLFTTETGLARFQSVETQPDARGRGLAGTLVHYVGTYGFTRLGVHTLVMVADPDYSAIRLYRSVGFEGAETQLQVERRPSS